MDDAEEEKARGRVAEDLDFLAGLLDPHLHSAKDSAHEQHRAKWSPRRTIAFIFVTSVVLWGLILWGLSYLIGHF